MIHVCSMDPAVLPGYRYLVKDDLDQRALESTGLIFTRIAFDLAMELRLRGNVEN